jgi:hypothetical protein
VLTVVVWSWVVSCVHTALVVLAVVVWSWVVSCVHIALVVLTVVVWSWLVSCVHTALVVLAVVVWSWVVSCVHCVHTAYHPAPHNHSQHNQCRTPYAVIHGLDLLMMGIMMPETCWDRSLIINIGLVESFWFIFLHPQNRDSWKRVVEQARTLYRL